MSLILKGRIVYKRALMGGVWSNPCIRWTSFSRTRAPGEPAAGAGFRLAHDHCVEQRTEDR